MHSFTKSNLGPFFATFWVLTVVVAIGLLAMRLGQAGIPSAIHYHKPLHRQPAFAGFALAVGGCPVSERLAEQLRSADEWRDQICTYFLRKSGIPDAAGRPIYP